MNRCPHRHWYLCKVCGWRWAKCGATISMNMVAPQECPGCHKHDNQITECEGNLCGETGFIDELPAWLAMSECANDPMFPR
jgi:ABC-type ATPase with predicted acetyltransferase domain